MKHTKLYSIITSKCPVCHTGEMYKNGVSLKLSKTIKMHKYCSNCETKFNMEPYFFVGAMRISYLLLIPIALLVFYISFKVAALGAITTFVIIMASLILLLPLVARVSRNIWINFFLDYDKSKNKNTTV